MTKSRKKPKPAVNMRLDKVPPKQFEAVCSEMNRRGLETKKNAAVLRFLFADYHRLRRLARTRRLNLETLEPIQTASDDTATNAA